MPSDALSKANEGIEGLGTGAGADHKTPARLAGVAFGDERGRREGMGGAGLGSVWFAAAGQRQHGSEQRDARKGGAVIVTRSFYRIRRTQARAQPGAPRFDIYHDGSRQFPLPTTQEWGEG